MKMNVNKLMSSMFYTQDLIKEFTNYSKKLDDYFSIKDNIYSHIDLYNYYWDLKNSLQELAIKHKVVK